MDRRAFALVLLLGCTRSATQRAPSAASAPRTTTIDDSLRRELLGRLDVDQRARERLIAKGRAGQPVDSADVVQLRTVDSLNTHWLTALIQRRGWPSRSVVSPDGANAAFILVQHPDRDTAFQAAVLPLITYAVAVGEADGQDVVLLTDRLAVARMHLQIYGAQADVTRGHVVIKPIADSLHVDERRALLDASAGVSL